MIADVPKICRFCIVFQNLEEQNDDCMKCILRLRFDEDN
jgi:hypothetical protein